MLWKSPRPSKICKTKLCRENTRRNRKKPKQRSVCSSCKRLFEVDTFPRLTFKQAISVRAEAMCCLEISEFVVKSDEAIVKFEFFTKASWEFCSHSPAFASSAVWRCIVAMIKRKLNKHKITRSLVRLTRLNEDDGNRKNPSMLCWALIGTVKVLEKETSRFKGNPTRTVCANNWDTVEPGARHTSTLSVFINILLKNSAWKPGASLHHATCTELRNGSIETRNPGTCPNCAKSTLLDCQDSRHLPRLQGVQAGARNPGMFLHHACAGCLLAFLTVCGTHARSWGTYWQYTKCTVLCLSIQCSFGYSYLK